MKKGVFWAIWIAVLVIFVVGLAVAYTFLFAPPSTYSDYADYTSPDGAYTVTVRAAGYTNSETENQQSMYVKIFCRDNATEKETEVFERSCNFAENSDKEYFEFIERDGGVTVAINDINNPTRKTIFYSEI